MSYVLLSLTPNHISRFPFRRTTSSKQQYACIIALLFTFGFACVAAAQAHKVTVLHTFESIPDGASPYLLAAISLATMSTAAEQCSRSQPSRRRQVGASRERRTL